MPDLSAEAITVWLEERAPQFIEVGTPPPPEEDAIVLPALHRLGAKLDAALARNPTALAELLTKDPGQARLRTILATIGAPRRLLGWVAASGLPDPGPVLAGILRPEAGGADLRRWVMDCHRQVLLERIFSPERLAALLAACRQAKQELAA